MLNNCGKPGAATYKLVDDKRRRDKGDRHFCLPSLRSALRFATVTKDPVPVCPG